MDVSHSYVLSTMCIYKVSTARVLAIVLHFTLPSSVTDTVLQIVVPLLFVIVTPVVFEPIPLAFPVIMEPAGEPIDGVML